MNSYGPQGYLYEFCKWLPKQLGFKEAIRQAKKEDENNEIQTTTN